MTTPPTPDTRGSESFADRLRWARVRHATSDDGTWRTSAILLAASLAAGVALPAADHHLGGRVDWYPLMDDAATTTVLVIVAGAMITLAGLVFTALTTVMQTGMMSLSVRIVPLIRRDRIFRWSMATFISAFGYCVLVALAHAVTDDRFTPLLSTAGALLIVLVGAGLLIALVARTLHLLDPATLLATMATVGHRSLDGEVVRLGERPPTGSALLAVNTVRLNALQRRWGVDITLLCGVGDALTSRTPVLSLASATDGGRPALTPARRRTLLGCLAIGDAYAPRNGPVGALRTLVDIALKALPPAANDPSRAVQVLDALEEMLVDIVDTTLSTTPSAAHAGWRQEWEDYVGLATDEIRLAGVDSLQIGRRLREMLHSLLAELPEDLHGPLLVRLEALDATIADRWPTDFDRGLAATADPLGVGASRA
ncbi:MAG TPA: DUF2254 domain-containing protein [Actinomycetales bacterium]|nr:DUF2254 domain-containing protein [Actinomycetales bacterium]